MCRDAVQALVVSSNQTAVIEFNDKSAARFAGRQYKFRPVTQPQTLVVIYSYGDFHAATTVVRSDDLGAKLDD